MQTEWLIFTGTKTYRVLIIGGADYVEGDLNGQKALLPEWLNSDIGVIMS
jgi:hypothetical protein